MHNSMTLRDNLGDITGKAGSQGIATSLIGKLNTKSSNGKKIIIYSHHILLISKKKKK